MKENLMQRKRRYLLTPKKELAERCLLIEQELNKLHSIIKEVRENIEKHTTKFNDIYIPASESWYLLETLDKENI